jgi:hypothetical protein
MATVKSRSHQFWIFLFEGFNLAHGSSLIHIWSLWGSNFGHHGLAKFRFWPTSKPLYKNMNAFFGPGPNGGVYLDFSLSCPAKIAVGLLTLRKWRPFENYLIVVWNALTHTEKVGKNLLLLACPISPLFWHIKFHKPGMQNACNKLKMERKWCLYENVPELKSRLRCFCGEILVWQKFH